MPNPYGRPRARVRQDGTVLPPGQRRAVQRRTFEWVGDEVGRAVRRAGLSSRAVGRAVGRDMTRTLWAIQKGRDVTLGTLSDIACATGHRLVVRLAAPDEPDDPVVLLRGLRDYLVARRQ